jgi:3-oxoacyl-[acyl-carrier-protein] synthase-3
MQLKRSKIAGIGFYVPKNIVKNDDLKDVMETTDEWIQERTGIKERRYVERFKENTTTMAVEASKIAIERAGITANDIDFIIFATLSPDYFFPGCGVLLQRELGIKNNCGALDIRNQCSAFVYGLSVADQFIKTGMYKKILVVGAEIQSSALDKSDEGRSSAVIFADGAGAAILGRADAGQPGILSTHLHSEGAYAEELYCIAPSSSGEVRISKELIERGDFFLKMNGNAVFKHAVVRFMEVIQEALSSNGVQKEEIDLLVPHQANLRISQYIQQKLQLPDEKVFNNIMHLGNTTAATIPIALSQAWEQGRLKQGDLVCLAAFGSGFAWASALLRW